MCDLGFIIWWPKKSNQKKHFHKMHKFTNKITISVMMLFICDRICALSASAINSQHDNGRVTEGTIVEYYKDHEVTEKQARDSLITMKDDEFLSPSHCKPSMCTDSNQQYCRSENLLKDHCCCNQSHKKG
jgi:hypothetical protein